MISHACRYVDTAKALKGMIILQQMEIYLRESRRENQPMTYYLSLPIENLFAL